MNSPASQPNVQTVLEDLSLQPMSKLQVRTILLCLLLVIVDGFDVLAMAFVAPSIASDWHLSPDRLGYLLSIGLAGMAVGAFFLSPAADRIGRRPTIILCLVIVTGGMAGAATATSLGTLLVSRFITGVGVGAMTSSGTALVYEYSSAAKRGIGMGVVAAGFPIGAVIGGSLSITLIDDFGWRSVFLAGAIASVAMLFLITLLVPESLAFLLKSRRSENLVRVRKLMRSLHITIDPAMIDRSSVSADVGLWAPFSAAHRRRTAIVSLIFLLVWTSFYFVVSWTPKLVAMASGDQQRGLMAGVTLNIGGAVGGLAGGFLIARLGLLRASTAAQAAMALVVLLLGLSLSSDAVIPVTAATGFILYAVMTCIYSILGGAFPSDMRATAIGIVQTVGRIGAALGPLAGGVLITHGLAPASVCAILAAPAAIAIWFVRKGAKTQARE